MKPQRKQFHNFVPPVRKISADSGQMNLIYGIVAIVVIVVVFLLLKMLLQNN